MAHEPMDAGVEERYEAPTIVALGTVKSLTTQDETSLDDPN